MTEQLAVGQAACQLGYDALHIMRYGKGEWAEIVNEEFSIWKAASELSKQIEGEISSLRSEIEIVYLRSKSRNTV